MERHPHRRRIRKRRAVAAREAAASPGRRPDPAHRIDLRVLLLSADGCEPTFGAWRSTLQRTGVPHDVIVAGREHPPIGPETLTAGPEHALYGAVVVATGGLPAHDGRRFVSALEADEWAALADFERAFAVRRITAFAYPSDQHGLRCVRSGSTSGLSGRLTAAGREVFRDLRGDIPLDPHSYGHLAAPVDGSFRTLVCGPDASALLGVYTHPDGREELVCTVDGNAGMLHVRALAGGMLDWVTRGVHLGRARHHLAVQVDDVFLSDDSWDAAEARTVPASIRMEPDDVAAAAAWSRERRQRLDLVFNGHGASPEDPLTRALLEARDAFGWVSHTYSHFHLDNVPGETLETEIARNVSFAAEHGLPIDVRELVTGEHSGLRHPALPTALRATGVRFLADDNSRETRQQRVGPALTVPRHPTNLYFNVCHRAAQLDEHHHLFTARAGRERGGGGVVRLAPATSWERFVQVEVDTILGHVLGNDPRPHYVHQSNLTGDRMAFELLDAVLERHRALFTSHLEQPTLAEAGVELARQVAWQAAAEMHRACAYLRGGRVHVRAEQRLAVPLTGVVGTSGEDGSGWTDPIGPEDGDVAFALA